MALFAVSGPVLSPMFRTLKQLFCLWRPPREQNDRNSVHDEERLVPGPERLSILASIMNGLIPISLKRLRHPTEQQLRVLYWVIALVALIAIIVTMTRGLNNSVLHTDDCLWDIRPAGDRLALVVTKVIPGGNADKAGVRVGDRVLRIGDGIIPLVTPDQEDRLLVYAQTALRTAPVDVEIPYVVERGGEILNLRIVLDTQFIFLPLLAPAFALLWLIIGVMVALTRPRGLVQKQFFFTAALVIFAFTIPPLNIAASTIGLVVGTLWLIAGSCFFPSWLYFCTVFPIDQKIFNASGPRALFYTITLFLILYPLFTIAASLIPLEVPTSVLQNLTYANIGTSALLFGGGVWFLYRSYKHMPTSADRRAMTVILVGTILAGIALFYITMIQTSVADIAILYPQYLLPLLLLLALPISFGYAIFRYQVMDFRRVVKTTLVYTATMALIAGLYLAVAYGVGQALGALTGEEFEGSVEVFSFVLFLLLFEPVKRRVQTAIENRFFPQRRDYSGHLAIFAAQITETVGAEAVALRTATTLQQALDLRGVCVVVENPFDGELKPMARTSEFAPVPVYEETIAALRHLLRQTHNLTSLDTIPDPAFADLQGYFPYVIGLYAQGRVIGAILMSRTRDGELLSGSQTSFIAGVAGQAAAALEVARLYEEELARQRYREELATARRIQESLLPATMPQIPGISISAVSQPAQAVGGDYYDVIRMADDRFMVIVADVSGKGLPASLYMAEFHGMVHVACGMLQSPKEILTTLNEHLFEVITRGSFITATMLLFDTTRKSVSFARAGHTPIIRRNRSEVDTLIPAGVALGLCSGELFAELLQEYTVEYETGEMFILYSDGVSEAMNQQRDEFGEGRLHDLISAAASDTTVETLRNRILTQVEMFRGTAEQNDDITVVVVQVDKEGMQYPAVPRSTKAMTG